MIFTLKMMCDTPKHKGETLQEYVLNITYAFVWNIEELLDVKECTEWGTLK
jgi:hypothetical protein